MVRSKATLALIAVLVMAVSAPVFARKGSGGTGRSGSHASSGARVGPGHPHTGSSRHTFRGARIAVFAGAAVYGPLAFGARPFYYPLREPVYFDQDSAPEYIQQEPDPSYWYFCPDSSAYYPYVQACPGGWQQVVPAPPAPPSNFPG